MCDESNGETYLSKALLCVPKDSQLLNLSCACDPILEDGPRVESERRLQARELALAARLVQVHRVGG